MELTFAKEDSAIRFFPKFYCIIWVKSKQKNYAFLTN